MTKLTGTATLDYCSETRPVQVSLNLEENAIEVRHPMLDFATTMSRASGGDWHRSTPILTDLRLSTPIGIIRKDRLEGLLVAAWRGGTRSVYDSTVGTALSLRAEDEGISTLILHPRSSGIEFSFEPFNEVTPQFEAFYRGSSLSLPRPRELLLRPGTAVVAADAAGAVVRADHPWSDREELVRLSLGVISGGPVSVRSVLADKSLTVNLAGHDARSAGRLHKKPDDGVVALQGVYDFLSGLSPDDRTRWGKATHFFLQGLGGIAPLEVRAINLFTFLEILDDSKTLSKNSLAYLLDIPLEDADLLCHSRNRLIHHGDHIEAAIRTANGRIRGEATPLRTAVFSGSGDDEGGAGVRFFFRFARLLNALWIRKAHFAGEWNDFSDYEC